MPCNLSEGIRAEAKKRALKKGYSEEFAEEYAKGYAEGKSDVDLCLSTSITGLRFVGLIERLRTSLHKKVDLLRIDDLKGNVELLKEIFKDGMKIYGEPKNQI